MSHVERERGPTSARTVSQSEVPATDVPEGMLRVIRRVSGKLLSRGPAPADVFEPLPPSPAAPDLTGLPRAQALAAVMAPEDIPSGERLVERVDLLYPRPLSEAQERALQELKPDDRRQFSNTLDALSLLKQKKLSTGEFLRAVLKSAAELAGKDRGRFVELTGLSLGAKEPGKRQATVAAELLERLFVCFQVGGDARKQGFSPEVLDAGSSSSLLPRFGELLSVGKNRWALTGKRVLGERAPTQTPGERRLSQFALMVGRGLRMNELTPREAAELTGWALGAPQTALSAPLWSAESYRLESWLEAWRGAGPPGH